MPRRPAGVDSAAQQYHQRSGAALPWPLLGSDLPKPAQHECDSTAPAEDIDSDLFQLLLRIALLDAVQNLSLESFQRIIHSTTKILALKRQGETLRFQPID